MRNLLAVIGLLVVGFAILGWYLNWYSLSVTRSSDGKLQISTDVDTNKLGSDANEAMKNLATVVGRQVEKAAQDAKNAAPAGAPGTTPGPVNGSQGSTYNPLAPSRPEVPNTPSVPGAPSRGPIPLIPPK